ncbi:type IV pilin protein [uncultured Methylibium sp.]|uniref:type IV pilin protein n=1 Tax=uncultured Methylibium sp. TaxID=381093 RepID=UPI0025E2FCAE|nr:type IV pilin protein [uncultured Methylibium sp.]
MTSRRFTAQRGYSLIELLIVVVIAGVLATLAYPSYAAQLNKGRRTDAISALYQVQQAQERWRANHSRYTDDLALLGLSAAVPDRYRLSISTASADGYTATATAQWPDGACTTLSLGLQGGQVVHGASGSASPRLCWNR